MKPEEYLRALKRLGLTVASKRTAEVLGIAVRQSMRYGSGEQPVSAPIAKLLRAMVKWKLDPDEVREL